MRIPHNPRRGWQNRAQGDPAAGTGTLGIFKKMMEPAERVTEPGMEGSVAPFASVLLSGAM